jgi:hypothetical protein
MDPVEAIAGEPRRRGADEATAPRAARWLQNPTPHDDSPEPDSYDWWMRFTIGCCERTAVTLVHAAQAASPLS